MEFILIVKRGIRKDMYYFDSYEEREDMIQKLDFCKIINEESTNTIIAVL